MLLFPRPITDINFINIYGLFPHKNLSKHRFLSGIRDEDFKDFWGGSQCRILQLHLIACNLDLSRWG